MREEIVERLKKIVGDQYVITRKEAIEAYLVDETPDYIRPKPAGQVVLVKPGSTEEVAAVLKLANQEKIHVYPRGGGTGLVGAAVPTSSGIILSLERMNKIAIDKDNLFAEAEAGVTLAQLIEEADKAGLFFPAHPGDEGAQIGGLVACNAGGSRALKTGVMRSYVKGIEVVLPTGEVLRLGGKLLKDNAGYDIMQLFIGSEGTLGVITKAYIRLYPRYEHTATLIVPFDDRLKAIKAVPKILHSSIIPLALEYFDRDLAEETAKMLGLSWPVAEGSTYLMIILAEPSEEALYAELEKIAEVCSAAGAMEPFIAETRREQEAILKIRSSLYEYLKPNVVDILDVTVPPASIGELMEEIAKLEEKYGVRIPTYGHAGDGNLHPHILRYEGWTDEMYDKLRNEIYEAALRLGGTITGEHGIGALRRKTLKKYYDAKRIEIMKAIKKVFDPNNILNPDKVIP